MTTYKDAGVDIAAGDNASAIAYRHAASTFASRAGMLGEPVYEEGGFAGFLDMGDYYIVQSDDGTGSKIDIALAAGMLHGLGSDLLAMVADDAVCTGAEVISLSNTLDVARIDTSMVDALLAGLAEACTAQKIVIPAGEIAEVPGCVHGAVWSATSVGVVTKERIIRGDRVAVGDAILSLREQGARSNGFSLIRTILRAAHGEQWHAAPCQDTTWAQAVLTPSTVYHAAVLGLTGRFREERAVDVHGIAHITGGGIPAKLGRVLRRSGYGASLTHLWQPPAWLTTVATLGEVSPEEQYRTWNMGNGMLVIVPPSHVDHALTLLQQSGIDAQQAGTVTEEPCIELHPWEGPPLRFPVA